METASKALGWAVTNWDTIGLILTAVAAWIAPSP